MLVLLKVIINYVFMLILPAPTQRSDDADDGGRGERIITTYEKGDCLVPLQYGRFTNFYRAYQQSKENGINVPPDIAGRTRFVKSLMIIYKAELMDSHSAEEDVRQILESVRQIMPAPADVNFEARLTGVIEAMNLLLQLNHRVPHETGTAAQILAADADDDDGNPQEIDLLPTDKFNAVFIARMRDLREKVKTVLDGGTLITVPLSE